MNRLLCSIDETAKGTEYLLWMEGGNIFQGIKNGIDIFIVSQVSHLLADEEVPGKEPSLIRFVKADVIIRMSWCENDHKTKPSGPNL